MGRKWWQRQERAWKTATSSRETGRGESIHLTVENVARHAALLNPCSLLARTLLPVAREKPEDETNAKKPPDSTKPAKKARGSNGGGASPILAVLTRLQKNVLMKSPTAPLVEHIEQGTFVPYDRSLERHQKPDKPQERFVRSKRVRGLAIADGAILIVIEEIKRVLNVIHDPEAINRWRNVCLEGDADKALQSRACKSVLEKDRAKKSKPAGSSSGAAKAAPKKRDAESTPTAAAGAKMAKVSGA